MKCIKIIIARAFPALNLRNGDVIRTSNDIALQLVNEGKATYSSKGAWKSQGRNYL